MAGFNPFSMMLGGLTQRLQTSPFAGLLGIGQGVAPGAPPGVQPPQAQVTQPPLVRDTTGLPADGQGNDLRGGISATAQALGIDPLDLATVISYETGGTFDPNKKGPTTQYGTHRGFIQFGEPQAKENGVDWNNSAASQLGPDGAIAKYLRKAGVKPGMGLLDLYSAVNAGSVGKYNASDANNGGAPGTVQDKVLYQMDDHRKKARELLGGTYQPGPTTPYDGGSSILDRVMAAAGVGGPQAGASPQAGGRPQQPQSVIQRALAAAGMPATSRPSRGAGMQSGGGQQQQPEQGAVDTGAEEIAALPQALAQRRMASKQRSDQRRQKARQS